MKNIGFFAAFVAVLLALFASSCTINFPEGEFDGGTVVITNNSNRNFKGTVWTDSGKIFSGTIRAGDSKVFCVPEEGKVYPRFECSNGCTSSPSGYASEDSVLILEL